MKKSRKQPPKRGVIVEHLELNKKIKNVRVRSDTTGKYRNKLIDKKITNLEAREFRKFLQSSKTLGEIKGKTNIKTGKTVKLTLKQQDHLFREALSKNKSLLRALRSGIPQATAKFNPTGIKYMSKEYFKPGADLKFKVEKGKLKAALVEKSLIPDDKTGLGKIVYDVEKIKSTKGKIAVDVKKLKGLEIQNFLKKEARKLGVKNYADLTDEQKRKVQKLKKRWLEKRADKIKKKLAGTDIEKWTTDQKNAVWGT